jgi:hypothetical protein
MELLADRDPQDARKLARPVFAHMMAAVHRFEDTDKRLQRFGHFAFSLTSS